MWAVSEGNVELHRRATEAFNARDIEAGVAYCDPSIEYHAVLAEVGDVYRGHEGIRRWLGELEDVWDDMRSEPETYFELADKTLEFAVLHGRARQSGVAVAMPIATVMRWRDALCVYAKAYARREDALRDLGVTGDELEPIAP